VKSVAFKMTGGATQTPSSSLFLALGSRGRTKTRAVEKMREDYDEAGREGLVLPRFFLPLAFTRPQQPRAWNRIALDIAFSDYMTNNFA